MFLKNLAVVVAFAAAAVAHAGVYTPFLEPLGPGSSLQFSSGHPSDTADFNLQNGRLDLSFDYYKSDFSIRTNNPGHVFAAAGDFDSAVLFDVSNDYYKYGWIQFGVIGHDFSSFLFGDKGAGIGSFLDNGSTFYLQGPQAAPYESGFSELRIQRTGDLIQTSVNASLIDSYNVGFVQPVQFYFDFKYLPPFPLGGSPTVGLIGFTVITPEAPVCTVTQFCGVGGTGGIPEPASWALLLVGFGLTGAALRCRRVFA